MRRAMQGSRIRRAVIGVEAVVSLLALAACGVSTAGTGGSPTSTSRPNSGLTVKPCGGAYAVSATPTLTLGDVPRVKSGTAHVGDTIAIRMDGQHVWNLGPISPGGALTTSNRDGMFDKADGSCVWLLHANATGAATITLTGRALCDPNQACPQYVINQTYDVTVS
jgi:hypothetical protein